MLLCMALNDEYTWPQVKNAIDTIIIIIAIVVDFVWIYIYIWMG